MEIVILSQNPELLNECAELLNKQWRRSTSARVQSLEKSFLDLPDSLLLLETTENGREVIGHSRLTKVLEDPHGCWIGSVVIRKDKRKKGLGKYIMKKSEEYAKALQFSTAYLNTQDQQGFYEHLGYVYCNPVSSIGFTSNIFFSKQLLNSNFTDSQNGNSSELSETKVCKSNNINSSAIQTATTNVPPVPPPPPPPPLQVYKSNQSSSNNQPLKTNLGHYWMKKEL